MTAEARERGRRGQRRRERGRRGQRRREKGEGEDSGGER